MSRHGPFHRRWRLWRLLSQRSAGTCSGALPLASTGLTARLGRSAAQTAGLAQAGRARGTGRSAGADRLAQASRCQGARRISPGTGGRGYGRTSCRRQPGGVWLLLCSPWRFWQLLAVAARV